MPQLGVEMSGMNLLRLLFDSEVYSTQLQVECLLKAAPEIVISIGYYHQQTLTALMSANYCIAQILTA